jgi:hypothetical protein
MALHDVIERLKKEERHLIRQLRSIRNAISSLEMGAAVSPSIGPAPKWPRAGVRKRRRPAKRKTGGR